MTRPSRRRILAGAVVAALAAAAVVAYAFAGTERYEAEAAIEVTPVPADDETFAGFSVLREDQDPVETAAQLLETAPVAEAVAVRLRLDGADEALDRVEADADARGRVVRVRGDASEAAEAAQVANAFADELVRQRSSLFQNELQRTLDALRTELANVPASRRDEPPAADVVRRLSELRRYENLGDPTLRVAGTAIAPRDPERRNVLPILALGLPLAALLGTLVAIFPTARRASVAARPVAPLAARSADQSVTERERQLTERIETITEREREVARRAAGLTLRERDLDTRDAGVRERELVNRANELALERRERELAEREQAIGEEPPPPEPEHEPEPEPEPERVPEAASSRAVHNIAALEHAVEARTDTLAPQESEELHAYLVYLRGYADPDGTLPHTFDALVDDVFGALLRD